MRTFQVDGPLADWLAGLAGSTVVEVVEQPEPADAAYFLDTVNGNDAGNGRSVFEPKQTLAALLALEPPPGSTICVKGGSRILSGVETFAEDITWAAYGVGPKPVVDGFMDIRGTEADWFEVDTSGNPLAGTNRWRRNISLFTDNHSCIVFDGQRLKFKMAGSFSGITEEGDWRCWTANGQQYAAVYSAVNPALRWQSIGISTNGVGFRASHPGNTLHGFRIEGFRTLRAVEADFASYDCEYVNAGAVGLTIWGPAIVHDHRPKVYEIGRGGNGEHGMYPNTDDPYEWHLWDTDTDQTGEDNFQSVGKNGRTYFHSTYPGATMFGRCESGENPIDMKTGELVVEGAYLDTYGSMYEPITVQGSTGLVRIVDCCVNAFQAKPTLRGQETRNWFEIENSGFYTYHNATGFMMSQSGGGYEGLGVTKLTGNIIYTTGPNGSGAASAVLRQHRLELRNNTFIGDGGVTCALAYISGRREVSKGTLTSATAFPVANGKQRIRIDEHGLDYLFGQGIRYKLGGLTGAYAPLNGIHVAVANHVDIEYSWTEFELDEANAVPVGPIDLSGAWLVDLAWLLAFEGNLCIASGNPSSGKAVLHIDPDAHVNPPGPNAILQRWSDSHVAQVFQDGVSIGYQTAAEFLAANPGSVAVEVADDYPVWTAPTSIVVDGAARIATVTCAADHGLTAGQKVLFRSQGTADLRGFKFVHEVISPTVFTFRTQRRLGSMTESQVGEFTDFAVPVNFPGAGFGAVQ